MIKIVLTANIEFEYMKWKWIFTCHGAINWVSISWKWYRHGWVIWIWIIWIRNLSLRVIAHWRWAWTIVDQHVCIVFWRECFAFHELLIVLISISIILFIFSINMNFWRHQRATTMDLMEWLSVRYLVRWLCTLGMKILMLMHWHIIEFHYCTLLIAHWTTVVIVTLFSVITSMIWNCYRRCRITKITINCWWNMTSFWVHWTGIWHRVWKEPFPVLQRRIKIVCILKRCQICHFSLTWVWGSSATCWFCVSINELDGVEQKSCICSNYVDSDSLKIQYDKIRFGFLYFTILYIFSSSLLKMVSWTEKEEELHRLLLFPELSWKALSAVWLVHDVVDVRFGGWEVENDEVASTTIEEEVFFELLLPPPELVATQWTL